ncbi:hypothetical protein EU538_08435 [Candidatus Thorarchaeota archaeon]|nr:MAG: hypothetical protein EU538_08435 [Candidatus Thorarchaeota archaeon]
MSELKCCKLCGAFKTCTHKGECCIECRYFDPVDMICLAPLKKKKQAEENGSHDEVTYSSDGIDPQTFLFEDDEDLFDDDEEEELEEADFYDDEDEYDGFDDSDDDWN